MGAGVIPFCVKNRQVHFLLHRGFVGRKAGYLVDFGGGGREGESYRETAIREFIEETETMFFSRDIKNAMRTDASVRSQIPLLGKCFDCTLREHPDWWCQREPGEKIPPRDWRTYFVEIDCRDVSDINREWETGLGTRFTKRRELVWIPSDELADIYRHSPDRLWKRVRQLRGAEETIQSIRRCHEAGDAV